MKLERLTQWTDPRFAPMWQLYEASFPSYENRTLADQKRAMEDPDYHIDLIYPQEHGEPEGFVMYWLTGEFLYLEHFAMLPAARGNGCGSRVLEVLKEKGMPIVLEIDPPQDKISIRRKGFYQRAGFFANDYHYIHIPYKKEAKGHPLVLMTWPQPMTPEGYQAFYAFMRDRVAVYSECPLKNADKLDNIK